MTTRVLRSPAAALLVAIALLTSACSGGSAEAEADPGDVLAAAKEELDTTSGVSLRLSTPELPSGVDGVLDAQGVGTLEPAFDGDIKVSVNGLSVDVPVVSVDGTVYATLPFTKKFVPIDPGDYGAPDPAALLAADGGVSSWLTEATDVEEGEQVREGEDVLTSYTGTLPGSAVVAVIPSADEEAEFPVEFSVDDEGLLSSATVSGPFYGDAGDVEYTLEISDYGTEQDITAP